MAQGDITVFDEFKLALLKGIHDLDGHTFKCAILDDTATPTAATATPALSDFTEVGAAGTYTTGGETLTISLTESAGTATFDETSNPSWAANASNDTDAYWALVYNFTAAGNDAICFVDLGGPIDMQSNDIAITWHGSGIFTLA